MEYKMIRQAYSFSHQSMMEKLREITLSFFLYMAH
ncbi:MAG: hypothetical protein K0R47_5446 [Brevibacillus sp.]|nr:hypothetical protein [Brevibacillus sp.]